MANSALGRLPDRLRQTTPPGSPASAPRKSSGAYLYEQIEYRRSHRGQDLISQIVHFRGRPQPCRTKPMMVNTRQLLFARQ